MTRPNATLRTAPISASTLDNMTGEPLSQDGGNDGSVSVEHTSLTLHGGGSTNPSPLLCDIIKGHQVQ